MLPFPAREEVAIFHANTGRSPAWNQDAAITCGNANVDALRVSAAAPVRSHDRDVGRGQGDQGKDLYEDA